MFSEKLLLRLKHSSQLTIMTGAGVSAESGVPTFRGKDGLWNNYDVQQLATPQSLRDNTEIFWKFYSWRRELLEKVKPNLGHYALVDMENFFEHFTLITQNVDNLHRIAGNKNVLEIHGNIMNSYCIDCGERIEGMDGFPKTESIPKCHKCGGFMRPDVVLFGEHLDPQRLRQAQDAAATCEVFLSIGTSAVVEPAASLPYIAKGNGAYIVEINAEKTPLTDNADESLIGQTGKILPLLIMALDKMR